MVAMDVQLLIGVAVALLAVILGILFFLKGKGGTEDKPEGKELTLLILKYP